MIKQRRTFWLSPEDHKKLLAYSKKTGKSMSEIIREWIKELINIK